MPVNLPGNLQNRLKSCRTLPSAPGVVVRILDLAGDPDAGTALLAREISYDPALSAKILKVANSAWCRVLHDVTTLDQAVSLLGFNGTMSLALSFSLVRRLRKISGTSLNHKTFWRRSVISASAAMAAGACKQETRREELFLAGLLQDIGMLVLNEAMPEYGKMIKPANDDHNKISEIERDNLDTDHAQVGGWILGKWGLPDCLVEAVTLSHSPENATSLFISSVIAGSRVAEIWINPDSAAATTCLAETFKSLPFFSIEDLDAIITKTAADTPAIIEDMDFLPMDEKAVDRLMDQAREALSELNMRTLRETRNLALQSQKDPLTSLYNRAYLNLALEDQFVRSQALAQPMTALFIDIDNLKQINDTFGHHGGDGVLISIAETLQAATRNCDVVVRYGGDEFVVLLVNSEERFGAEIAERIRTMVEQKPHKAGEGTLVDVTVSIGMKTMSAGSKIISPKELLEAADISLYGAKASGRNRVSRSS
ncbi:MAG TPA: GGDEF domain-containing protein [Acidobacteriota bacterium]|nr:GGDEF domain-containing protein [Acidobacteriota bacterium]